MGSDYTIFLVTMPDLVIMVPYIPATSWLKSDKTTRMTLTLCHQREGSGKVNRGSRKNVKERVTREKIRKDHAGVFVVILHHIAVLQLFYTTSHNVHIRARCWKRVDHERLVKNIKL